MTRRKSRSIAPEVDIFDHPIQLLMSTIDLALAALEIELSMRRTHMERLRNIMKSHGRSTSSL